MPKKAVVYKLITRPRCCSSTMVCRIVLQEANCTMTANPITTRNAIESQTLCENEKAIKPIPNVAVMSVIHLPNPTIVRREAR